MGKSKWQLTSALALLALAATACGGSEPPASEDPGGGADGGGGRSGTIAIDGSSTVAPLTDAIAEEYLAVEPDVRVNTGVSGTGGGFERFCGSGDTQISNASRPIKAEEAELCESNGFEYIEVRVGTDALTMVTNPASDWLDCLTTEEVVRVFGPDGVDNWNQVRPEFPDEPLTVFAPGADSGTYDFMVEDVLDLEQSRQDYTASENDNIIAQGVIGTPASWGFFGFAYFSENEGQLKALAYDAGNGCVEPSVATAQDGTYEMTRPLFIYVRQDALAQPHVADFVAFYLDNVGELITDVGYIPAAEEQIEESRAKVEAAVSEAG